MDAPKLFFRVEGVPSEEFRTELLGDGRLELALLEPM